MLVTQCDECKTVPVVDTWSHKHRVGKRYAVTIEVRNQGKHGGVANYPDLCPDCFWKLVRKAIPT